MPGDAEYTESTEDLLEELQTEDETPEVEPPEKEEPPKKESEEKPKKEEEEEEEEEKEEEEKEEPEEKDKSKFLSEITKKYPTLFKDFPNLRHVFFHERQYRELFPTIEEAKEAADDLEGLVELEKALASGEADDIAGVISSMNELGEDVVENFADNFLPSLKSINQDLYYKAITPELVNFTRIMFDAGVRNENTNLCNAALMAALHFFGDPKIASGEKQINLPKPEKRPREDSELENERRSFRQERYTSFYNDVVQSADGRLAELIADGIDPKNNMTKGMKALVVEKVSKEISKTLSNDSVHGSRMNGLWRKAGDDNFSSKHKSKIISAYLEAAEEILPRVRSKVRAEVLGIRTRHPENKTGGTGKRAEPESTTGGGRQSTSSNGNLDPKKIDWRKTSDLDLIKGNVTYKK